MLLSGLITLNDNQISINARSIIRISSNMKRSVLKQFRFWAPPAIIIAYTAIAARTLGFEGIAPPTSIRDLAFNLPVVAMAVGYYLSPIRSWANSSNHSKITQNIKERLLRIGGYKETDDRAKDKAMNVFYRQIDADKSLAARSEDIMFNGLVWTTLADAMAISIIFSISFTIVWATGILESFQLALGFLLVAGGTFVLLKLATEKHLTMSENQLEYIEEHRRQNVIEDFRRALDE